jgi:hypothetical protein
MTKEFDPGKAADPESRRRTRTVAGELIHPQLIACVSKHHAYFEVENFRNRLSTGPVALPLTMKPSPTWSDHSE